MVHKEVWNRVQKLYEQSKTLHLGVNIPGVLNGLLATNQGFFPKYAGGFYQLDNTSMIVSRGLARESTRIPRIFNRPEIVIINVIANDRL